MPDDRWANLTPGERYILTNELPIDVMLRLAVQNLGMVEGTCDKSSYEGATKMLALRAIRHDLQIVLAKLEGGCNGHGVKCPRCEGGKK